MEYLLAVVMGVVEGLTEFLPVSSTGHLILAGHASGFSERLGKPAADAFEVIIQLGAILAVVAAYPHRFLRLLQGRENRGFSGLRGIGLLVVTTLPAAVLGLLVHAAIEEHLFSPMTVALALAVGAVWILLTERWAPQPKVEGLDSLGWRDALHIGLFQCLSLWPGMSRSASTILGGMISGVERKTATEYSFFAAVPVMIAATGFKMVKSRDALADHLPVLAVGFIVSFIVAWLAVKGFVWFLGRHTLVPFGWYRLALAGAVFWLAWRG